MNPKRNVKLDRLDRVKILAQGNFCEWGIAESLVSVSFNPVAKNVGSLGQRLFAESLASRFFFNCAASDSNPPNPLRRLPILRTVRNVARRRLRS